MIGLPLPDGWSVEVTGNHVVVFVPRSGSGRAHAVNADEAEALSEVLKSASVVAGRYDLGNSDPEAMRVEIERLIAAEKAMQAKKLGNELGQRGYEIRDCPGDEKIRQSIEAWLPGWHWPVVRAVVYSGSWLVLVDPIVAAAAAGVGHRAVTALEAVSADEARQWVDLLTALYTKAAAQ